MSALLERDLEIAEVPAAETDFEPGAYFERWLADVQAALTQPLKASPDVESQDQEIFLETRIGSDCELSFEGVLHFDGYSIGNVKSPSGTLVLSNRGRIEADIEVGTAIIDGSVTGNITASERVLLQDGARVKGQIFTPALSMQLGAVLDGDCLLDKGLESSLQSATALAKTAADSRLLEDCALSGEFPAIPADEPADEFEELLLTA